MVKINSFEYVVKDHLCSSLTALSHFASGSVAEIKSFLLSHNLSDGEHLLSTLQKSLHALQVCLTFVSDLVMDNVSWSLCVLVHALRARVPANQPS